MGNALCPNGIVFLQVLFAGVSNVYGGSEQNINSWYSPSCFHKKEKKKNCFDERERLFLRPRRDGLHQVTFQTVLVTSVLAENGVTEEQTPGFKGAFLNGLERIAPDIEEATGEHVGGGRGGGERLCWLE